MSKKVQPHVKRHNLERSERAKKKVREKNARKQPTPKSVRTDKAIGTFRVKGGLTLYPVGPSGYVPKGGVRQYAEDR